MNERNGGPRPLVIVGMPRSGTTWTKQVIECAPGLYSLMEPDSEGHRASSIWGKQNVGRFPVLVPGDRDDDYHRLWHWILGGALQGPRLKLAAQVLRTVHPPERKRSLRGQRSAKFRLAGAIASRPSPRRNPILEDHRLVVKSVHAPMSIEWVAAEFDVDVLVVHRHPGSILASWIGLDYSDQYVPFQDRREVRDRAEQWGVPLPGPDHLEQTIWRIGMFATALEEAAAHNPTWLVRSHEQLCRDPVHEFQRLFDELGLEWNQRAEDHLAENDREGKGFRTQRRAADLPDDWKTRLTPHQVAEMQRVLAWFPLTSWSEIDLSPGTDG